jgi:dTDP-4-dehydrorhamnose reductase
MSASILITGANGQVGYELARADSRHRRVSLTRDQLDISNREQVESRFDECQPDLVINAAAYTQVDRAETEAETAYAVNRDGVRNLAAACAKGDIPLLHVSTDYIFSGDGDGGYREDDPADPRSVYGASKAAGETVLRETLDRHVILRTSWVFSAQGNNFVKTMLRLGRERTELGIVADQFGCPTSARSIAAALLAIAEVHLQGKRLAWGTYHFCNWPSTTWFDFASRVFLEAKGYDGIALRRITTAEYPTAAVRPMNSILNCDKLQAVFALALAQWPDELRQVIAELEGRSE